MSYDKSWIDEQIKLKLDYDRPYYGKLGDVKNVQTDFDNFPYNRFFRSKFDSPYPSVYERKSGYRQLHNKDYQCPMDTSCTNSPFHPDLCFSAPSSTTYPCYPAYFFQYANEIERNNALNRYRVNTTT